MLACLVLAAAVMAADLAMEGGHGRLVALRSGTYTTASQLSLTTDVSGTLPIASGAIMCSTA